MSKKGEIDSKIMWIIICLILLIVLIALFYSAGINLIKEIIIGQLGGNGG